MHKINTALLKWDFISLCYSTFFLHVFACKFPSITVRQKQKYKALLKIKQNLAIRLAPDRFSYLVKTEMINFLGINAF